MSSSENFGHVLTLHQGNPASAKTIYAGDLVQTKAEHLLRVTLESNVKHTVQIIDNFGKQPISIGSALEMIIAKDKPDWGTLVVPAGEHEGTPLVNMIGKAMAAWGEGHPARTNKKNDTRASADSRGRGDRDGQGSGTKERPSRSSSDSDDSSDTNSDKPPRRGNSSSSGAELPSAYISRYTFRYNYACFFGVNISTIYRDICLASAT